MLKLEHILEELHAYHPNADTALIKSAYLFANEKHDGQFRASGEPYIIHPLSVARNVVELGLDERSIAAALLHDVVEDTEVGMAEIEERFGKQVAVLVDGVTKLSKIHFASREERQAENFRKMMLAMSKDIRVILVKLADRLHNMRTLEFKAQKPGGGGVERIARETMEIYAPLANRLGIYSIKSMLEDLSFRYLYPEDWDDLNQRVDRVRREHQRFIDQVKGILGDELANDGYQAELQGRLKHLYSIYRKMKAQGIPFEEVYDLIAFRVILDKVSECWHVLGVVHQLWKPIPGRFRDFVDLPKPNGYRSLHTSVIGPNGEPIEIQIRTREMHEFAERGIAAHWKYKEGGRIEGPMEERIMMLKDLLDGIRELHQDTSTSQEFMSSMKEDLFGDEIFVFTPKGEVRVFPRGATPVDFAYSIHSEVGFHCSGAKVNGTMVPLSYPLHNGDIIQIMTSAHQTPNDDWLKFVRTSRAKTKIRTYLRQERRQRAREIGQAILEKELRKRGKNFNRMSKKGELETISSQLSAHSEEDMLVRLGNGKLALEHILHEVFPDQELKEPPEEERPTGITGIFKRLIPETSSTVLVGGEGDVMTHFARCCSPLPGDNIVGYVNRTRGISVHRKSCRQMKEVDPDRQVEVQWDRNTKTMRAVRIKVQCEDQTGMLAAITQVFTAYGANIVSANCKADGDKRALNIFEVSVRNASQLKTVIRALERIPGVINVLRN